MTHLIKTLLVSCAVVTLVSACGQNGALFLENANTATPENNEYSTCVVVLTL